MQTYKKYEEQLLGKLTHWYLNKRHLFIAVCLVALISTTGSGFALWHVVAPNAPQNISASTSSQAGNAVASKENNSTAVADSGTPTPSDATSSSNPTAPGQKPGPNASTPPPGYRAMSPYDNCPPQYQPPKNYGPGGYTFPPAIRKTMPAKTVTIPYGKTSGTLSFTSPDNVPLGFASYLGAPGSGASAQVVSGYMTPTVTISIKPGSGGFTDYLNIGSVCYEYQMPIYFHYEQPPALNFNVSYNETSNSLSFTAAGKVTTVNISYAIVGCNPAAGSLCYGNDSIVVNASAGQISLDPLFPEIDTYFAQYDASGLTLTLNPIAPGYQPNTVYVSW